jgi:hypothetical protein
MPERAEIAMSAAQNAFVAEDPRGGRSSFRSTAAGSDPEKAFLKSAMGGKWTRMGARQHLVAPVLLITVNAALAICAFSSKRSVLPVR